MPSIEGFELILDVVELTTKNSHHSFEYELSLQAHVLTPDSQMVALCWEVRHWGRDLAGGSTSQGTALLTLFSLAPFLTC